MAGKSVFAEYPGVDVERPTGQEIFLVVLRAFPKASADALDEAWRAAGVIMRREVKHRRAVEVKDGVRAAPPRRRKPPDPLSGAAIKRLVNQAKLRTAWRTTE